MSNKISIIFLGSGPVALESLLALIPLYHIEAIITKPATFREMQAILPEAEIYAVANKNEMDKLFARNSFKSTLAILIDFGIIITQSIINSFPLGIINSHFSLLPQWRGADPITFTVLSGQTRTGVSLMLLTEGLDEGPLLAQAACDVPPQITTPELTARLIEISNVLLKEIVPVYVAGDCIAVPQLDSTIADTNLPTYSRKLTKDDGLIDWSKPAQQLAREIRAFIGWPKSRTILANKEVIITAGKVVNFQGAPGSIITHDKQLIIGCGENALEIERLKPAGKADMSASAFLAGYKHRL